MDRFIADAISGGSTGFSYGSPANAQSLLIEFNRQIDGLVRTYGIEPMGRAIWYLYGCASNTTHDALAPAVESRAPEFYRSIHGLYDNGFAKYCDNATTRSEQKNNFETACYMLWDMDSGLNYHTFGRPELFSFGEELVDFGLAHAHAACQESFLHCLGHLRWSNAPFVEAKIDRFLMRNDLDPVMREYAGLCRRGCIQ